MNKIRSPKNEIKRKNSHNFILLSAIFLARILSASLTYALEDPEIEHCDFQTKQGHLFAPSNVFSETHVAPSKESKIVPILLRPVITLPFDMFIYAKQILRHSYQDIGQKFFKITMDQTHYLFSIQAAGSWIKASYTYPLQAIIPSMTQRYFPELEKKYTYFPKILYGALAAAADALFITPVEHLKTFGFCLKSVPGLFINDRINVARLYQGTPFLGVSSLYSTSVFLTSNHFATQYVAPDLEPKIYEILQIGTACALTQSVFSFPVFTLRARLVKASETSNQVTFTHALSFVKEHGIKVLYSGWRMQLVRSIVALSFDSYWLAKFLDKKHTAKV